MNQVQTSSHALSQSSSVPVIQLDNDYQPTCSNNSVPINPGLPPGSSSPGGDNRSHLRSIYHSTMDATTFCSVASTHIVPVPISSVIGCVEAPVIRGGGGSSSSCSSNASVAFQIKRESDPPGSPPVRSPSAHSLPSNCSAPSYFVDISNPIGSHVIDAFCVRKHEFSEEKRARSTNPPQAPLPTQRLSIEHGPHYNNCESIGNPYPHSHVTSEGGVGSYVSSCSSMSGSSNIHSQSPFHPDSSQPPALFGNQRCSLSSALSTLPLPSQVPGAAILDTNDRCTSTIAPLEINSGTITTAVVQPMDSSPAFYSSETVSSLPNFAILPVNSSSGTVVAAAAPIPLLGATRHGNSNGTGHFNAGFGPCDLSTSTFSPFEQNPCVKSRRYSYPQEPIELCRQQYTKEIHMSSVLDNHNNCRPSHHSTPSPHMFKTMPNISPCVVANLDATAPVVSGRLNGCHNLSTPMSSCGGEDVQGGESSAGGDSQQDQKLIFATDGADIALPGFDSPEAAFYQYQHRMEGQRCQVCGELAAGFHHGAYVCEACKKFFMRHSLTDTKPTNVCPTGGNCVVAKGSRGKCQICRFRKCLLVGMKMKDPELQPEVDISNIPCRVCGGRSSGFHFGALTCEGCKGFFRRTEGSAGSLVCVGGQNTCTITPRSRNACKSCRFRRCLVAGMSKKGSRIGRQPNAVKFHCAIEIRQLQGSRSVMFPGGSNDPSGSGPSGHYGPFSVDVGGQLIDVTGPASLQNHSDVDSPNKCSPPDGFTSTFRSRQNSTPWSVAGAVGSGSVSIGGSGAEHKPPLSLLLFLPPGSDPIDSQASGSSFSDSGGSNNPTKRMHCSSGLPQSQHILRIATGSMNSADQNMATNHRLRLPSAGSGSHPLDLDTHSASEEDDIVHSPNQHPPYRNMMDRGSAPACHVGGFNCGLPSVLTTTATSTTPTATTTINTRGRTSVVRSLLDPFGFPVDDPATYSTASKQPATAVPSPQAMTALLITNLAKRLAEEDQLSAGAADEMEDVMTSYPPSQEAVHRFTDGMRTATEFLRLPNTYFKSRFRMTSIPLDHRDNTVHVWSHMMNHFHMHAQQIVQFAKLVPGFNQLGITARSNLVRGAMYPVVLLLLSRDYRPETDEYNYFDFTLEEREIIMQHFPSFLRITEHLRIAGCLLHGLGLSLTELSLSSAVEILRNYQLLEEPTKSNTKDLFVLAHHSLRTYMIGSSEAAGAGGGGGEYGNQHRWTQLMVLSKMIHAMNREHHQILSNLKDIRPDLQFPELYIEMFQLADSASALFSASAKAVTLACSTAFQTLAPLKLSLSQPTVGTNVAQASSSAYNIPQNETMIGSSEQQLSLEQQHQINPGAAGFLPVGDRWDAGRFALAVPAAMAAMAAAAAEASSSLCQPPTIPPLFHHSQSSAVMNQTELQQQQQQDQRSNSSGQTHPPYFQAPSSLFFPPQTTHPSP